MDTPARGRSFSGSSARRLEVLGGFDGFDPRRVNVKVAAYTNALDGDALGMKITVVKEGFVSG